jgi:hypothetical protein
MIAAPTDGRSGNEWLRAILLRVKVIVFRCQSIAGGGVHDFLHNIPSSVRREASLAGTREVPLSKRRYRPGTNLAFRRTERTTEAMKRSLER